MLFRLVLAIIVAMALGASINGSHADGMPEVVYPPAPTGDWIIVQSDDALTTGSTAYGNYAASSGDVRPGTVTLMNEATVLPDILVEVDRRDRVRPGPRNRR